MKRFFCLLLALVLLCGLAPNAFAENDEAHEAADALHLLGLFRGKGTNPDGTPIYALDDESTRNEAVTMLVRLLGKEDEAKAGTWETPFSDVAEWAKPYVGYAYEHGLTKGTGDHTFGGASLITASQYLTFVLRALGYESGADFSWNAAWELTDRLGITEGAYGGQSGFTRGDVAIINLNALDKPLKGQSASLLTKLAGEGAIDLARLQAFVETQPFRGEGNTFRMIPELDVYSESEGFVRSVDDTAASPLDLEGMEYISFGAMLRFPEDFRCTSAHVVIDDDTSFQLKFPLEHDGTWQLHVSKADMERILPGLHTVDYYVNEQKVLTQKFTLLRDWSKLMDLPTEEEIQAFQPSGRAPYIGVYYSSGIQEGFTAFSVDFCADFLPNGTYLSIGCWKMDISELEQKYDQVSRDGHVAGYAGVQTSFNGSTNTIMSLWDIYYVDDSGQERTLRPELVYALNSMDSGEFSGEGTGAHCIVSFEWERQHWYRLTVDSGVSGNAGNVEISLSICDLETGDTTLLCRYDTGLRETYMKGSLIPFLENYLRDFSGYPRTMELCNMRVKSRDSGEWVEIEQAAFYQNFDYAGSYNYGSDGHSFWVITTGLPDRCELPEQGLVCAVKNMISE